MLTQGFDYMQYYEMRRQELLQQAQQHRLAKEALKARPSQAPQPANIPAAIDREPASLGKG
jgi:hypothetical protein